MPRAVFFDMDDTLLDSLSAGMGAWEAVCAMFAPAVGCDAEVLRAAIRRETNEFWKDESKVEKEYRTRLQVARTLVVGFALAAEGLDTAAAPEISAAYGEQHRALLRPFDDAIATLDRVRAAGFQLGLLTNGPRALQRDKIERFDLAKYFDVIVIEEEFGVGKPDPTVFAHGLRSLRVEPAEAWHVGDNLYADISGAQRAGMHAVWIHRERLELREPAPAIPDRTIAHLDEIAEPLGLV